MSKRQLIDHIRQLNPTAEPTFLGQFDEDELMQYLDHLRDAHDHRLRIGGWVRKSAERRVAS